MRPVVAWTLLLVGCATPATPAQGPAAPATPSAQSAPASGPPPAVDALPTLQPGPPFGDEWCVTLDAIWSEELARKHLPAEAAVRTLLDASQCSTIVDARWPSGRVQMGVDCGDNTMQHFRIDVRERAVEDADIGGRVDINHRASKDELPETVLLIWDRDTPCLLSLGWAGSDVADNDRRARALAKDVATRLTPQRIARPRAELVYTAQDTSGDAARAALASWAEKKAAFDTIATLAPGYPRVARSDEFPELPKGNFFLLFAICRSRQGARLTDLLMQVYPPLPTDPRQDLSLVHYFNVDGLGLPLACPSNVTSARSLDASGSLCGKDEPNGNLVTWTALIDDSAAGGQALARVAAFLFSPDRHVLDAKTAVLERPLDGMVQGQYQPQTIRRYDKCRGTIGTTSGVAISCDVHVGDHPCLGRPDAWGISYSFSATQDQKLEMNVREGIREGTLCQAAE
jgi:hypothetical protein